MNPSKKNLVKRQMDENKNGLSERICFIVYTYYIMPTYAIEEFFKTRDYIIFVNF